MKIVIGCDHGALALKEEVKKVLAEYPEIEVNDVGTYTAESVDYPDIAEKVCAEITSGRSERGIVLCGTGIGISIAANRVRGVRAGVATDLFSAQLMREHNDANVLGLGARVTAVPLAMAILEAFLATPFAGGRHQRRIEKLDAPPPRPEGDPR